VEALVCPRLAHGGGAKSAPVPLAHIVTGTGMSGFGSGMAGGMRGAGIGAWMIIDGWLDGSKCQCRRRWWNDGRKHYDGRRIVIANIQCSQAASSEAEAATSAGECSTPGAQHSLVQGSAAACEVAAGASQKG
jgi:hypothetical protein